MIAKPFLKWAGGKTQLLPEIRQQYPQKATRTYIEPFVGAGAVLFDIVPQFAFDRVIINDLNAALINAYKAVKEDIESLVVELQSLRETYLAGTPEEREVFYYSRRAEYNTQHDSIIETNVRNAALFVFLNKTCFNGLYRVNRQGYFNASHARYKNPAICDTQNLLLTSQVLQNVDIRNGSYEDLLPEVDSSTFLYLDPPYRPISTSANFNSYDKTGFNDDAQTQLKLFVDAVTHQGGQFLLSNSDPTNAGANDAFFDDLYSQYLIRRVSAARAISSKGTTRGKITEILVSNYGQ